MSELLDRFISEARGLIEETTSDLLELERDPGQPDVINAVFRAVHTVKGASGVIENVTPLTTLVHAGEDVLDAVRRNELDFSPAIADLIFDSLDLVGAWLDDLEEDDNLPSDAGRVGQEVVEKLRALIPYDGSSGESPTSTAATTPAMDLTWLDNMNVEEKTKIAAHVAEYGDEVFAVVYEPEDGCFFHGDDPLNTVRGVPGLLGLVIGPGQPWTEDLEAFDPYACNLSFKVISIATEDELDDHFRYVADQIKLAPIPPSAFGAGEQETMAGAEESGPSPQEGLIKATNTILNAQLESLEDSPTGDDWAPYFRSVEQVLHRTFKSLDAKSAETTLTKIAKEATGSSSDVSALRELINSVMREGPASRNTATASLSSLQRGTDAAPTVDCVGDSEDKRTGFGDRRMGMADRRKGEPERRKGGPDTRGKKAAERRKGPAERRKADLDRRTGDGDRRTQSTKLRELKVDQERINALMDLAGELVVAKNAVPFLARKAEEDYGARELSREIKGYYQSLNRIAEDIQSAVMQIRMVPVSFVFNRFPRLIRDMSRKLEKKIDLVIEGEDTEADKNIIEELADPLIHLVRNSIDHGIETPEDRLAAGKSETGTITLRALQENDRVVIQVIDDGAGIEGEKLKQKALSAGVIDQEAYEGMNDKETLKLIFAPGLSSVEQVSDLSGRGVGMDVVRVGVEQASGTIDVDSERGKGSCISMSLPLAMVISNVMIVEVGGQSYGVPMDNVIETVRLPRSQIQPIKDKEAIILRDTLVPVGWLSRILQIDQVAKRDEEQRRNGAEEESEAILVVGAGGQQTGLVVDNFQEGEDVVLKPMQGIMARFKEYTGTALLGDGRVLLVLDVKEIMKCL